MIQAVKNLGVFLLVLLMLGYVGNLLLDNPYVHGFLRQTINRELKVSTLVQVRFEAVGAKFLPPGVEAYGVEVNDMAGKELFRASHIKLSLSWVAALFSRKELFEFEINEPRLQLPLPPLETLIRKEKFPELFEDTGPTVWPPEASLPFYRIAVTNAQIGVLLKDGSQELLNFGLRGMDAELNFRSWSQYRIRLHTMHSALALEGAALLPDTAFDIVLKGDAEGLETEELRLSANDLDTVGMLNIGFELAPPVPQSRSRVLKGLNLRSVMKVTSANFGILGRYLDITDTDGTASGRIEATAHIPLDERKAAWEIEGKMEALAARIAGFKLFESKADFTVREEGLRFDAVQLIKNKKEIAKGKGFLGFAGAGALDFDIQAQQLPFVDLMDALQVADFEAFTSKLATPSLKLSGQMMPFKLNVRGPLEFKDFSFPFVSELGTGFPEGPTCAFDVDLAIDENKLVIDKGEGPCRDADSGSSSPLALNGTVNFSETAGMDLTVSSKALDLRLLNHFTKQPAQGLSQLNIRLKGPYSKLVLTGDTKSHNLAWAGFALSSLDSEFELDIEKSQLRVPFTVAEISGGGRAQLRNFQLGLSDNLPFSGEIELRNLSSSFMHAGLRQLTGDPRLSFGLKHFQGHLEGDLKLPLRYRGAASFVMNDLIFDQETILSELRGTFNGTPKGQTISDGFFRVGKLDARYNLGSDFGRYENATALPSFLEGLGLDGHDHVTVGIHTIDDSQDQVRANAIELKDDHLSSLPFVGSLLKQHGIGGSIVLDTDLEGPAGHLQGKIDGGIQKPFVLEMPISALSFSGFLDGTRLQLPEFRHAGSSLVGRLNIDFGKPGIPYDWYIYLRQFDIRAVLGKFFADDPRNYAYLSAEWTMSGQLEDFWKSKGQLVFNALQSKLYRNLGNRTTAIELASDQTVIIDISPERWGFEDDKSLKLKGDFFELEVETGRNAPPNRLDVAVKGALKLDILRSFSNLIETARGEILFEGGIKGSIEKPEFSMRIRERKLDPFNLKEWNPVSIGLVNYGPALTGISMDVEVKEDRLVVHKFAANKGREGKVEIAGTLMYSGDTEEVSHLLINLDQIEFNRLPIPVLKSADAVISGDLTLSGNKFPFNLAGNLKLDRFQSIGSFDLRREIVASLYESKLFTSSGGVTPSDPLLTLDIGLQADRSILVKNKTIEANLSANLKIKGTDQQPLLLGQIIAENGTFNYRRTFKITQAVVSFDEPVSPPNPRLDISGEAIINPYKVTVQVTGDLAAPKVNLLTDPPNRDDGTAISSLDVVLLITTGKLPDTTNKTAEKASVNEIFSSILVFAEEPIEKLFDLSGQTVVREVYIDSYISEEEQRPITRLNLPFNFFNQATAIVQVDHESNTKISFEYPVHEGITLSGSLDRKTSRRNATENNNLPADTGFDLKFRFGFD